MTEANTWWTHRTQTCLQPLALPGSSAHHRVGAQQLHDTLVNHFCFLRLRFLSSSTSFLQRWLSPAWYTLLSTREPWPHSSTLIIIITDEKPFAIFLNYRSGIPCSAHIPAQAIIFRTEKCFVLLKENILPFFSSRLREPLVQNGLSISIRQPAVPLHSSL